LKRSFDHDLEINVLESSDIRFLRLANVWYYTPAFIWRMSTFISV